MTIQIPLHESIIRDLKLMASMVAGIDVMDAPEDLSVENSFLYARYMDQPINPDWLFSRGIKAIYGIECNCEESFTELAEMIVQKVKGVANDKDVSNTL